ncbi:MAG: AAA domain-containing protein [Candidatus Gastranaerophilales bacterium]|nr:AAA domain-containing protein [Candidatus Gastranaerophilales bacterium]
MLETPIKAANKLFGGNFIKRISLYLHDCIREEVQSSTFRNLKGDKDNKWVFLEGSEEIFTNFDTPLVVSGENPYLTELMIQAEVSQKEKHLLYGYLFLVGKNTRAKKNNEFLTPLLYSTCKIERAGKSLSISILEDTLSLNTGALSQLMKKDDEDEIDAMLQGLIDVIPELPLNKDSLEIFLSTLKSLIPDVEIETNESVNEKFYRIEDDFYSNTVDEIDDFEEMDSIDVIKQKPKMNLDKLVLKRMQSVILTKRPTVTAGVLHELTQISEKSTGTIKETALGVILDEYNRQKTEKSPKDENKSFFPVTPLSLSESQEDVIRKIENNDILAVYGPPGTGKSQTIVNLVSHLIANGKTVLVASRMDKAVDVVAQRLNEFGAPYLALRAGRANYQKQLCFQLEDLLSGKVELNDECYMDSILVDTPDMKELLDEIKRIEGLIEKIIYLEEKYTQYALEEKMSKEAAGEMRYINEHLCAKEIELLENIIAKLKNNLSSKETFVNKFFTKIYLRKIRKLLNLKRVSFAGDMISRVEIELDSEKLSALLSDTEEEIIRTGNLHQLMNKLKMLKNKRKKLALEILKNKRRTALIDLLSDQNKRRRLIIHSKSLVSKKAMLQNRLLENQDFTPLLKAFPCWCTTTYAISNSLPLKPALFDVVIIDEASQCDIASCFPILYRAKKAVIVGDDKQLPHMSFLEKAKEQSFLNQYNIDDEYQLMWRFRTNSMFDLANYYSVSPVLLDEHFRSPRPIIEFSSKEFYGGRIKVMKTTPENYCPTELIVVPDGKVDTDITRNTIEAEAVIKKMQDIIAAGENEEKPVSIGVLSPFRGQVDLLKKDIMQIFSLETIQKHQIEVGTAHTFQGDEKDIMLMSWAIADNSRPQSLTFLQKPNLFNVAITRARKKAVSFISKAPNTLPEGLLRDYTEYVQNAKKAFETPLKANFKNEFEKEVFNELLLKIPDVKIQAGLEIGGVSADIVINNLVIELDGAEDEPKNRCSNTKKQAILERCGFNVVRLAKREWDLSKNVSIERIIQNLN